MLVEKMKYKDIDRIFQTKQTPFLVIDKDVIRHKCIEFKETIGQARLFYALKANPHKRIVKLLLELGVGFEISSQEELSFLLSQGVSPQRLISSNPVKTEGFIKAACAGGVEFLAFDSHAEIAKLVQFAPGSKVYVRLSVSNEGSQWPLSRKFGVDAEEAVGLLIEAEKRGLDPCGVTFHVGSQCTEEATWIRALEKSKEVWDLAESHGLRLRMLNIGGGFPINYTSRAPSIVRIIKLVKGVIECLRCCTTAKPEIIFGKYGGRKLRDGFTAFEWNCLERAMEKFFRSQKPCPEQSKHSASKSASACLLNSAKVRTPITKEDAPQETTV